jgi:DNA-binding NarL/FixJ family response regulator
VEQKQMTPSIRVVVANQPRLMRELVLEAIIEQPDIEVVGEVKDEDEIVDAVERMHPEFLIIALNESNQRPLLCDTLLRCYPEMKILALAPERNCSIFYWASFDIHEAPVEASEVGILNTLRSKGLCVGG